MLPYATEADKLGTTSLLFEVCQTGLTIRASFPMLKHRRTGAETFLINVMFNFLPLDPFFRTI